MEMMLIRTKRAASSFLLLGEDALGLWVARARSLQDLFEGWCTICREWKT